MFKCLILAFFINLGLTTRPGNVPECDQICGKWMSSEQNLIVQVYHDADNSYKGKIIWFKDDPSKPMEEWCDTKNPNTALRTRHILGMSVLRDLKYDTSSHSWEDGMIYDAKNGKEWNASVYINKQGLLKIKGYWHFKFIGRTMTFKRA
jgi:uncharacterized protein (DUF2147 family)